MRPETRYAKSGSVHVAYQSSGSGPVDLVWAPGTASHLELDWTWPKRAWFIERLGTFCRVIRFDKRGTGLSDRVAGAPNLEERIDDIRAVMDAAGSERAFIHGYSEGASMACLFGATYPRRTLGLILWGAQARWVKTDDYPWGQSEEEAEKMIKELEDNGANSTYLTGPGAGAPKNDQDFLDFFVRYARSAASPAAFAALERMNNNIDIRAILPSIHVPTLVMNRTGDPVANVEAARDLASRIAGARFVEFPGNTHSITLDDADKILAEIEQFVVGTRSSASSDRVLATILFCDIVGSTEQVARLGDRKWRDLLDRYNSAVSKELSSFRGLEVKKTGDGFVATFDGPSRAIKCACSIRESVRQLGIEIRQGLHAGECEVIGDDIGGISVHLAARIAESAKPGRILLSSTVKELVAGSSFSFEDRGSCNLKGVPGNWRLFEVQA
ncbi:MAG TPA: adenylate/guanylate cyclase domain-containing protein [Candidatus Angelobacter sp.]|nr:adenylate/guanylate cyclase domain-containing protein [Candidatus Angelobacter sp.]